MTHRFFVWLDRVQQEAAASPVGPVAASHGFRVEHMGGGCLAYRRGADGVSILISDDENDVPKALDDACFWGAEIDDDGTQLCTVQAVAASDAFALTQTMHAMGDAARTEKAEAKFPDVLAFVLEARKRGLVELCDEVAALAVEARGLANEFARVLARWLSPSQFEEMVRRNRRSFSPSACASHDFCDANAAMSTAFASVFGRLIALGEDTPEERAAQDADLIICNAAWELARREFIGRPPDPLNYHELSKLEPGDRVVFVDEYDRWPHCLVKVGTEATVTVQQLNEGNGAYLAVNPDDPDVREALREWDGDVHLGEHLPTPGHDTGGNPHPEWLALSPLARIEE